MARHHRRHAGRAAAAGFLLTLACARGEAPLRVLAAASLADVVAEAAAAFTAARGLPVETSFAASSTLARQIRAGAPADVFVSAHPRWSGALAAEGLIGSPTAVAGNVLVLAGGPEPCARAALGDPAHVPAGAYAEEALKAEETWALWQDRLVTARDARAAAAYLARGEVDCAFLYRTDAAVVGAAVVRALPTSTPIRYDAAVLAASQRPEAADFVAYLRQADTLWRSRGFTAP